MVSEIVDESVENTSVIKKIVNEALFFLVIDWKRTLEEELMERKMPYTDKNGTRLCWLLFYLLYWKSMQYGTAS